MMTSVLGLIRSLNSSRFPHTAVVKTKTGSTNVGGVITPTYTARLSGVPCRLSPIGATEQERLQAEQLQSIPKGIVVFDPSVEIRATDRVVVSGVDVDEGPWSVTLEILGIPIRRSMEAMRKYPVRVI